MSYDASNKVRSVSSPVKDGEQVIYDAAGRPIAYKESEGKVTRQLSYGYADKVVKVDNADHEAKFLYNAEGQLVGSSVAGDTTCYVWDGNVLAAEGVKAFTNEAHITGGVPAMAGDQAVIVSDYLGNTLSQGDIQFKSTAYGEGVEQGRFTGKAFVEELGFYVFHHRNYSPEVNRWSTADPSGFPDGMNNSLYVSGDPLSNVDPMGLARKGPLNNDYTTNVSVGGQGGTQNNPSADVTFRIVTNFSSIDPVSMMKSADSSISNIAHAYLTGPTLVYDTQDANTTTSSHYDHTWKITCKRGSIDLEGSYRQTESTKECEK